MEVQSEPARRSRLAPLVTLSAWALGLVALWPIASLGLVFAQRLTYPIDLEWCEGGSLYMAWRLLHHLPVYVKPGDLFAPFPYPPGHTLAIALFSLPFGDVDYVPGRLVSIASFAVLAVALFASIGREFSDRTQGVVGGLTTVAFLACSFTATGGWFDLVRVDSMMMAAVVVAAVLVASPRLGRARLAGTALAITIAVFTKQTAAFFAVWICLFAIIRHRRQGLALTAVALLFCTIALAALHLQTHGQYWFWIFENLTSHPVERAQLLTGLRPVLRFAPFVVLLPLPLAWLAWTRRASADTYLWTGMLLAALPASLLPYAKHGGWLNDMIPVFVVLAPLTISLAADAVRGERKWTPAVQELLILAAILFIVLRPIAVNRYVPDPERWAAATKFNARVANQMPGGVLIPQLAFTPARNGQTNPNWHRMGHADLEWSGHHVDEDWAVVRAQARWALLNAFDRGEFSRAIRRRYRMVGNLPSDERVRMQTGGGTVNLDEVWERLPSPGDPPPGTP